MSATFGRQFRLSIFGESHGPAIGVVLDGLPPGFPLDEDAIALEMARRAPGNDPAATPRKESDEAHILSGLYRGYTTGAPLCAVIENRNTRSKDYERLASVLRPGHGDYPGWVKYRGFHDPRGGGHFSARLTAPLVFAGSVARQILSTQGVRVGAHIAAVADLQDDPFPACGPDEGTLSRLHASRFPLMHPALEAPMRERIEQARQAGDSVGGQVEAAAIGVPAGVGSPFFDSVESVFAHLAFAIPAVKAVEFGEGTGFARLTGSQANDPLRMREGGVTLSSNRSGGVNGGITNGMPVVARLTFRPTPSIARAQQSVDIAAGTDSTLTIQGRHDPCVVLRAVPVVESALCIALCELMMDDAATKTFAESSGGHHAGTH